MSSLSASNIRRDNATFNNSIDNYIGDNGAKDEDETREESKGSRAEIKAVYYRCPYDPAVGVVDFLINKKYALAS